VMCGSSLCAKHKSSYEGLYSYSLDILSKITQIKKSTYDIRICSESKIQCKNQGEINEGSFTLKVPLNENTHPLGMVLSEKSGNC
jgi:hypothetical protein